MEIPGPCQGIQVTPISSKKGDTEDIYIESQFSHCPLLVGCFVPEKWIEKSTTFTREHCDWCTMTINYELLIKDKSVCIHHKNLRQLAIEMYKVKNDLSPPFMKELFTHVGTGSRSRTGGDRFLRPNVNTVHKGEHSLRSFGPILWNTMLPEKFKDCIVRQFQRKY